MSVKKTMRKSILLDVLNVLIIIKKKLKTDEMENFILKALSGEILDNKAKKQVQRDLS
jgi:predicted HAD superfamily phosphohydrolase YqeG